MRATGALRASLERRFRVVETAIKIGGRTLSIRHPASAEDLITEEDFVRDERLPYWAELWPSSRILAEKVIALKGSAARHWSSGAAPASWRRARVWRDFPYARPTTTRTLFASPA